MVLPSDGVYSMRLFDFNIGHQEMSDKTSYRWQKDADNRAQEMSDKTSYRWQKKTG
jgi:hypothetical protein